MVFQIQYNPEHHAAQQLHELRTKHWKGDSVRVQDDGLDANVDLQPAHAHDFLNINECDVRGGIEPIQEWVSKRIKKMCADHGGKRLEDFLEVAAEEVFSWIFLVDALCEGDTENRNTILISNTFHQIFRELTQLDVFTNNDIYTKLSAKDARFNPKYFYVHRDAISFNEAGFAELLKIYYPIPTRSGCPAHRIAHSRRQTSLAIGFAQDIIDLVVQEWTSPGA